MRIIAGRWRGRTITAPAGGTTRPTADRTREGLFSMLASRLGSFEGLAVVDVFAGSGALGLEALSRGAASACFIDADAAATRAIRANIAALGASANVMQAGVASIGPAPQAHDLVFLDPPYGQGLAAAALVHLSANGWIAPAAIVSVETSAGEALDCGWECVAERRFGKAFIRLLRSPGHRSCCGASPA
jgi:16S rRNA (guanine966-N2)-methyltransferase